MHLEGKLWISEQIQTAWNFIISEKAAVGILYLKHILTYQYVKIYVAYPNNILFLTIKSKQLLLFVWMLSRNFQTKFFPWCLYYTWHKSYKNRVLQKIGIHDFAAAYINRGIIMKKSCSEEEVRLKSCFQIRQNTIYYTNRVLLVLINCENTIFARF